MNSIKWGSNLGPLTKERNNIILNKSPSRLEYMKLNQEMDYKEKQKQMSSSLFSNNSLKIDSGLTKEFKKSGFTSSESQNDKSYLDSSFYSQSRINKLRLLSENDDNSK